MKLGIVGLPNVGKSTLFNSLTKAGAESANYPFCTIDPNVGIVTVPDARVDYLAEKYHSKKVIPAAIEFVDIAGLVKGASKGEGLGNQFLANIREVDAIVHVVRCFDDGNIVHVDGSVNPLRDIETINFELIFSDIEVLDRRIAKSTKGSRNDKSLAHEVEFLSKVKAHLEDGKLAKTFEVDDEEDQEILNSCNLLTIKPVIFAANVNEDELAGEDNDYVELLDQIIIASRELFGLVPPSVEDVEDETSKSILHGFISNLGETIELPQSDIDFIHSVIDFGIHTSDELDLIKEQYENTSLHTNTKEIGDAVFILSTTEDECPIKPMKDYLDCRLRKIGWGD